MWVDMVRADAAHPEYTIQLLNEAADMIDLIDRECSLCKPYRTLPDRVQGLIHNGTANSVLDRSRPPNTAGTD